MKNIPIYTIGDILPKAIGFFLLPIYTRYLTPADYGIVRSLGAFSFILVILFTLAFDRSLFRLYFDYKDEEDKKDLLGTIFITITAFSTILLFILFALQHWIGQIFTSIPFYPYYVYAIFSSYFIGFQSLINVYFQLKQKAALFVFFSIIKTLLIAGLGILYIIVLNEGAEGMLKASMLGSLLVTPIIIFYSLKISNFVFRWDQFKKISLFSLPLVPNLIAVWVMHLSNRIFLERFLTLSDVGLYSMAATIAELSLLFRASFGKAYNPIYYGLASNVDQNKSKEKLKKYNNHLIQLSFLVIFLVTFFSREAIILLLDPQYHESYRVIPFLSVAYAISVFHTPINLSIYQEKKTYITTMLYTCSAVLYISFNILLIPIYGIYGSAYAMIISNLFYSVIGYFYSRKYYFISFKWNKISTTFFVLSGITIVFIIFSNVHFYWSLFTKIFLLCVFLVVIYKNYYSIMIQVWKNNFSKVNIR